MIRVEGLVKKGHNMAKFVKFNNNATINQTPVEEQNSSKLGWFKTGLLIAGGAAATIGGIVGARKLYEHFTELDGELDGDQLEEDPEDGSGMESEEPAENTTDDSLDQDETSFKEVEPESNSDESIFVSAEELADTKDTTLSVPKPELDENGNYVLPKGKCWNDLVRKDIMSTFADLEKYFMNVSDTDMGDPIWVIRSSVSIFNKAETFANKTAWEYAYIESMRKDLYAYLMYYMRGLEPRFVDTHRVSDLIYMRRLFDEYLASPFYLYPVGSEMRDILNTIESEYKKYKARKYSPAPQKDELDEELESSNGSKEESEVVSASDSSVPSTPVEDDVAKAETAASSEQTQKEESSSEETANKPEGTDIIDQFKKDMTFLGGLMKSGKYADSQKFFRENLSTYLTDSNISEETRSELEQVQQQITNFLIAEKQAAAIEEANNCSRRTNKKKGGKRNYKKNGRK